MNEPDTKKQPIKCIGIIMDGNRRFAELRGIPTYKGHRKGYNKLTEVVLWARDAGVSHIVAYAFSVENWNRSEKEVNYLMKLFRFILDNEEKKMVKERVRLCFVGERTRFSKDIQEGMTRIEEATGKDYEITLYLAVSYGGRAEILSATNALISDIERVKRGSNLPHFRAEELIQGYDTAFIFENSGSVSEEDFSKKLWTHPMPDPDIIIRTGGERRLSGFLPWQSVYSELFFSNTLCPDFSQEEFDQIMREFNTRERRMGR